MPFYPNVLDPLESVRRVLWAQTRHFDELRALSMAPFEAAQSALRAIGATGLDQQTIDAINTMTLPSAELLRATESLSDMTSRYKVDLDLFRQEYAARNLTATLTRALEIPPFLRGFDLPTAEEMRSHHLRLVRTAESLAKLGWLFPKNLTPREIDDLVAEYGDDSVSLDGWFEEFYAVDQGAEFRALAARLLRRANLRTWRSSLRECLWAYRRGKYRVTIPTLLTTIEGLVSEVTGTIQDHGTNPSNHWRDRAPKPPDGFLLEIEWNAILAFLETLWSRRHFDSTPPDRLNRHWVQHGRRPELGTRADALRLFAAVDFIARAVKDVETFTASRTRAATRRFPR